MKVGKNMLENIKRKCEKMEGINSGGGGDGDGNGEGESWENHPRATNERTNETKRMGG